jgi:hypothetical protein
MSTGGKVCQACFSTADLRKRFLNKGATEALPFPTWRTETITYYPKPRAIKPRYRAPRKLRTKVLRERYVPLQYPFVAKPRDEHADLLAVNVLVPHMPGREDICQEIMLALWEKKITLDQIKANRADLRAFVRGFNKENYEAGGYAISLDDPMHDGRSWHDVLAAPLSD